MRHCYVVRVFTDGQSGGNPLGVIPGSVEPSTEAMQGIATKLGFSETVFVDWTAVGPPALRIFTPAVELPFAGHPLVGTAWVLNSMGPGVDRMSIPIGEVGIRMDNGTCWVGPPETDQPVSAVSQDEVTKLGVTVERAWRAEMPMDFLLAELADGEAIDLADPDIAAVRDACDGFYVFTRREPVRARFFAPRLGIDEDPATGSAAVALAAVLRAEGQASGRLDILQGPPGSLSRVMVTWDGLRVELGGTVVHDEVRLLED
jgi:PhzF family phenazine biosynthesis protein